MTEDFLHFIWKFRLAGKGFLTSEGEELLIVKPGEHNHDSGPDFANAQVRLGDTLWAGNVEIHTRSSEWTRHGHHLDKAYDNIILHVVFEHDQEIRRKNGELIPTLVLQGSFPPELYDSYNSFLNNHLWIPCALRLAEAREMVVADWLTALSVLRLERKSVELENLLVYNGNDWNQSFFQALASTLGFRINRQPFEMLARNTPVQCLEKHRDQLFQVEAMLFGQAGLLEGRYRGEYPKKLKKEYQHLKNKFSLRPISGHLWKFMRLRPNNFPTIRLAQLAMIIHLRSNLFSEIIEDPDYEKMTGFFAVGVSDYWKDHYYFDRPSKNIGKSISQSTVDLIMINNVIPFLFVFGKLKGQNRFRDKAFAMLEALPPEMNSIVRKFADFGLVPLSAAQSQALLELKTNFCDQKKCLECRIGLDLIR
jgi:hypothetical protein